MILKSPILQLSYFEKLNFKIKKLAANFSLCYYKILYEVINVNDRDLRGKNPELYCNEAFVIVIEERQRNL